MKTTTLFTPLSQTKGFKFSQRQKVNTWVITLLICLATITGKAQTGAALAFDGVDDRVDLGTTLGNFGTGNFTFETWFKSTATGDRAIVSKRAGCNASNFWNLRFINGALYFEVYGAANLTIQSPLATYNDGNWHHVACVRNINVYSLYVDGAQVAQSYSGAGSASPYNYTNTIALLIGSGPCGNFLGSLDETRLWNIARNSYEIQQTYNCEIATAAPGLLVNFHYNQGIGGGTNTGLTIATDASGTSNNGTLTNMALTGTTSNWVTPGAITSGVSCAAVAAQNFQLNGNGGQDWTGGNCYTLTTNHTALFGSMWYKQKTDLSQDFDMTANLNFGTNNSPGADGITFAFQNLCTSAGTAGQDIGAGGVTPSLIVEFDTYQNTVYGDPTYDHLAINKNGDLNHTGGNALVAPVQIDPSNINVETGLDYLVRIQWLAASQTLNVYVNGNLRTTYTGNIVATIFGNSPYVYWGFTAGTGGEFNKHKVCVTTIPTNVVSLASTAILCNGSSYQANIAGYTTYSWSPSTGVSNTSIGNPTLSPTSNTTYTLTVTDACSNTATQTIAFTVIQPPSITTSNLATVCSGNSVGISANGASTYVWSPSTGLNNANIANPQASPSSTTTYTVTGTANGCSATGTVLVSVNTVAAITISNNTAICNGNATQLTASGPSTFVWAPAASLNNATIANPLASPSSTTTYTVTGSAGGCSSTANVTITVNPVPSVLAPSFSLCNGNGSQIVPTVSPAGGTYLWSTGETTAIISVTPSSNFTYTLTYTASGCSTSNSGTVTVNALPTATAGGAATICPGNSTALTSGGGTTYSWSPASGLSNSNIPNPTANPSTTTTYTVTVGNTFGCTATATVTVNVNSLVANAGSNVAIICGNSTNLNASGGSTYSWSPSTGLSNASIANPTANPTATTTYTVTVGNGICTANAQVTVSVNPVPANAGSNITLTCGNTTTLNATGGTSYSWSPATGLSNSAIANPVANPSSTTTYTVTVSNGVCSANAQVTVTVNAVNANAGSNANIACGNSTTLNASGGNSYSWSPSTGLSNANIANPIANPQASTTYTVTVNNNGCIGTASVTVNVQGYTANAGNSTTLCAGSSTTLNGTATASAGIYTNVHNGYTFNSQVGSYSNFTSGTVIFNNSNSTMDDDVSGPITIPAFTFNNQTFTTIFVSTNGFITFGTAPSATNYTPLSSSETYAGCVAPFGTDLGAYSSFSSEVRYNTFGNDFVIQWKNFGRYGTFGTVDDQISFQIYLTSGTNKVSVIYSSLAFTSSATYYPQVGLRGPNNTFASNVNNRTIPLQGGTWLNNTIAGSSNTSTCGINGTPNATNPGNGTVFVWTPDLFLPATYLWSPAAGLSNASVLNPVATPSASTTYTLTVSYGSCTAQSTVTTTVETCTGIAEAEEASGFAIYPNPTRADVNVLCNAISNETAQLQLLDITGKVMLNSTVYLKVGSNKLLMDAGDLENGIYFVRLVSGTKTITGKLVLQQ